MLCYLLCDGRGLGASRFPSGISLSGSSAMKDKSGSSAAPLPLATSDAASTCNSLALVTLVVGSASCSASNMSSRGGLLKAFCFMRAALRRRLRMSRKPTIKIIPTANATDTPIAACVLADNAGLGGGATSTLFSRGTTMRIGRERTLASKSELTTRLVALPRPSQLLMFTVSPALGM